MSSGMAQYCVSGTAGVNPIEDRMDPMFLPGVEHAPTPGSPYTPLIEAAQAAGREYPKIWHLFAFKPHATQHLARFTLDILRGEAPLSPGFRELIAARTSGRNDCPF
jgi:alkylhydroperoxidase family enzyme